jgi:hypothetical protein
MAKKESKLRWWLEVVCYFAAIYFALLVFYYYQPNSISVDRINFSLSSRDHLFFYTTCIYLLYLSPFAIIILGYGFAFWLFINGYALCYLGGFFTILISFFLVLSCLDYIHLFLPLQILLWILDFGAIFLFIVGVNWRRKCIEIRRLKDLKKPKR